MTALLQPIGRALLSALATTGRLGLFTAQALSHCVRPPFYPRLIGRQMLEIGYYSLPVVGLTAIFTGMVLALQSYTGFTRFNAESAIPNVVVISITRELGPVLAGLIVVVSAEGIEAANEAEVEDIPVVGLLDAIASVVLGIVPQIPALVLGR